MRQLNYCIAIAFLLCSSNLLSQTNDTLRVKEVLVNSYIHGLIDAKDFDQAREGIHEDFVILGHRDIMLTKKTRDQWIAEREKRGSLPEVSYTIVFLDVVGDAASAKLELQREELVAIDYVFLYKFNNDWRIVSAIDHAKRQKKN